MKIILIKDVETLGNKNEVFEVKPGYARNYLIPRGLATPATTGALKDLEQKKKDQTRKRARELETLKELARKFAELEITLKVESGPTGKLFGTVTSADIAEAIKNKTGTEIDRRKILLEEPLKNLGKYEVTIKLAHEIEAKLKIIIEAKTPAE